MTKIGTYHFVLILTLYFYFFLQPFWFWLLSFGSLLVFPVVLFLTVHFQQQQFYGEFLRFLSMVILSMQRGISFLSSFETALQSEKWKQDLLLKRLYENVVFSQQEEVAYKGVFGRFIGQTLEELRAVHRNQHQAIDRLCNMQKKLQDRLNFRQKSRQIWLYFHYQLALMSVIYFGLLAYIVSEFHFSTYKTALFLSFSCYFFGLVSLLMIVRSKKWRI